MKKNLLAAALLVFLVAPAFADLYQWKDENGVIHITDSMEKVPQKYRGQVRVFKEKPEEGGRAPELETETPPVLEEKGIEELYGDQTLEWWRQSFQRKREEIANLQASVSTKTQFLEVFESGRRFGQVYDSESTAKYRVIKEELPGDLQRLAQLREEYEDFQREAIRAGVPKSIREP